MYYYYREWQRSSVSFASRHVVATTYEQSREKMEGGKRTKKEEGRLTVIVNLWVIRNGGKFGSILEEY